MFVSRNFFNEVKHAMIKPLMIKCWPWTFASNNLSVTGLSILNPDTEVNKLVSETALLLFQQSLLWNCLAPFTNVKLLSSFYKCETALFLLQIRNCFAPFTNVKLLCSFYKCETALLHLQMWNCLAPFTNVKLPCSFYKMWISLVPITNVKLLYPLYKCEIMLCCIYKCETALLL